MTLLKEPTSFSQAIQHPQWRAALQHELNALQAINTWSVVTLPPYKQPIGCKWVYKIKLKADGTIERLKLQKWSQFGVLLSVAALRGWYLH
jgi:hypothetical protein